MEKYIKVNGLEFRIATNDWRHQKDEEEAVDYVEERINRLPKADVEDFHKTCLVAQREEKESALANMIVRDACEKIFSNYYRKPQEGHGLVILAEV